MEALGHGRPRAHLIAAATTIAVAIALGAPATGAAKGKQVKVKLAGASQAALVDKGKVKVKVESGSSRRARLSIAVVQGGERTKVARKAKSKLRAGKRKSFKVALNDDGKRLVQSCIATKLVATAQTGGGRKLGQAKASMKRDPARCDGSNPVGVDLANADRCDFITQPGEECLFPYPNDYFTKPDPSTDTGRRLNLNPASTPANASGVHVDPTDINGSDGFSPGALLVLHVPGMDTPAAFDATGAVPITREGASFDADQPVVLIDAESRERQLIWTELDSNATSPGETDLLIHPAKNLEDGHRYIVALRGLKNGAGETIPAPEGFRLYRDKIPTEIDAVESRRDHFKDIFRRLHSVGVDRGNLYLAWDFTVASTRNISERMLSIRDRGLAELGDTTPGDGIRQGTAPAITVTTTTDYSTNPTGRGVQDIRTVEGTITVPCYLNQADCPSGSRFDLGADGLPQRIPGNTYEARFGCNIPRSAVTETTPGNFDVSDAALSTMYGHGLFGEYDEVFSQNVRQLGIENNVITCAADFIGMADEDVIPEAIPALQDLSKFAPLPDRLQQGFLDFVYLGRAMSMPDGFADEAAFKFNGTSSDRSVERLLLRQQPGRDRRRRADRDRA